MRILGLALAISALLVAGATAQTYPTRPVKLVVGAGAGSPPDLWARVFADKLQSMWGQPVVVDNRGGAGGNLGVQAVTTAEPDGYTLLFAMAAPVVLNEHMSKSMPFNPATDLVPITRVGQVSFILAVLPRLGVQSVPELIALAKKEPGKHFIGGGGQKTVPHLSAELFKQMAGVDMPYVGFRTAPQLITDFLRGEVNIAFESALTMGPHIRDGKMIPIGVTSPERMRGFENVPTIGETLPGYSTVSWVGFMAPKGVPDALIQRLNADAGKVLSDPQVVERYTASGLAVKHESPAEFARFIAEDRAKWGRVAAAAKIEKE